MSLMAQEIFAQDFLGSELLDSQGFLSRLLIYLPKSRQGSRSAVKALGDKKQRDECLELIRVASDRLKIIYDQGLEFFDNKKGRQVIPLTSEAALLLAEYNDQLEGMREEGGVLRDNSWGNRAPEHAARLATLFTVYKGRESADVEEIHAGIGLASHFLHTYLLLKSYFSTDEKSRGANRLWHYLSARYEIDEPIEGSLVLKNGSYSASDLLEQAEKLVRWGAVEIVDRTRNGTVARLKLLGYPE